MFASNKPLLMTGVLAIIVLGFSACVLLDPQSSGMSISNFPAGTQTVIAASTWGASYRSTSVAYQTSRAQVQMTDSVFQTETASAGMTETRMAPTVTITPTIGPSFTPSTVPTLQAHEWMPEPILLWFGHTAGDGGWIADLPPELLLFADGTLLIFRDEYSEPPLVGQLTQSEICRLLNTVDQLGFFDYDPTIYESPFDGLPSDLLVINAWRSNDIGYHLNLRCFLFGPCYEWLEGCDECAAPTILPSIRDTVRFLVDFSYSGLRPARVEAVLVWISEGYDDAVEWPLETPSIEDLISLNSCENFGPIIIQDSELVTSLLSIGNGFYEENGEVFEVWMRPMWPNESTPICDQRHPNFSDADIDTGHTLSCSPSDGVYDLPDE